MRARMAAGSAFTCRPPASTAAATAARATAAATAVRVRPRRTPRAAPAAAPPAAAFQASCLPWKEREGEGRGRGGRGRVKWVMMAKEGWARVSLFFRLVRHHLPSLSHSPLSPSTAQSTPAKTAPTRPKEAAVAPMTRPGDGKGREEERMSGAARWAAVGRGARKRAHARVPPPTLSREGGWTSKRLSTFTCPQQGRHGPATHHDGRLRGPGRGRGADRGARGRAGEAGLHGAGGAGVVAAAHCY